jgi:hypothetical protein
MSIQFDRILLTGCCGSILALLVPATAPAGLTESMRASTRSLGAIKIGMTIPQARMATGWQLRTVGSLDATCQYYQPKTGLEGVALMVTNGKIARIDITNPRIATLSGIRIGDLESRLKSVYGDRLQLKPHKYDNGGRYLIYTPRNPRERKYQLVFETDGRRVTNWRLGKTEEVNWIEGCQ